MQDLKLKVENLSKPLGVEPSLFTYEEYSKKKTFLLTGNFVSKCAKGLEWLYDPDYSGANHFTHANWGQEYKIVVLLKGKDKSSLIKLADQLLNLGAGIGLVYFQMTETTSS